MSKLSIKLKIYYVLYFQVIHFIIPFFILFRISLLSQPVLCMDANMEIVVKTSTSSTLKNYFSDNNIFSLFLKNFESIIDCLTKQREGPYSKYALNLLLSQAQIESQQQDSITANITKLANMLNRIRQGGDD